MILEPELEEDRRWPMPGPFERRNEADRHPAPPAVEGGRPGMQPAAGVRLERQLTVTPGTVGGRRERGGECHDQPEPRRGTRHLPGGCRRSRGPRLTGRRELAGKGDAAGAHGVEQAEQLGVLKAEHQRAVAAHGMSGEGAMGAIGPGPVVTIDKANEVANHEVRPPARHRRIGVEAATEPAVRIRHHDQELSTWVPGEQAVHRHLEIEARITPVEPLARQ